MRHRRAPILKKIASCHCGAVQIAVSDYPSEVTDCNCSLCHKSGVLWSYYSADAILSLPEPNLTDTYAWNGHHVDFHRCRTCGCVTHWIPRDLTRERRGINARLFPPSALAAARIRHRDGANTGKYLD
ncbi:GFA family protein [Novilysobacter erysipheiresistens]